MKESNQQTLFGKYLKENPPTVSTAYELKICKTLSMRWDRVAEHQLQALLEVSGGGHYWKLPDMTSMGGFASPKPFDCQYLLNTKAYIVVWFYVPRQPKVFHMIEVHDYIEAMKIAPRKSYREEDIEKISEKVFI